MLINVSFKLIIKTSCSHCKHPAAKQLRVYLNRQQHILSSWKSVTPTRYGAVCLRLLGNCHLQRRVRLEILWQIGLHAAWTIAGVTFLEITKIWLQQETHASRRETARSTRWTEHKNFLHNSLLHAPITCHPKMTSAGECNFTTFINRSLTRPTNQRSQFLFFKKKKKKPAIHYLRTLDSFCTSASSPPLV